MLRIDLFKSGCDAVPPQSSHCVLPLVTWGSCSAVAPSRQSQAQITERETKNKWRLGLVRIGYCWAHYVCTVHFQLSKKVDGSKSHLSLWGSFPSLKNKAIFCSIFSIFEGSDWLSRVKRQTLLSAEVSVSVPNDCVYFQEAFSSHRKACPSHPNWKQ